MKHLFRNILTLSLILVYSLSSNISIQNFVIDSILGLEQHQNDAIKYSEASKTLVLYLDSDNDFLDEVISDFPFNFEKDNFKTSFSVSKYKELYTVNKENQYLNKSKHIQPGLSIKTLLYPFHTFS